MGKQETKDLILKTIREKSGCKREVFEITKQTFKGIQEVLHEKCKEMSGELKDQKSIRFEFKEKGQHEAHLAIAGDRLIFHMHTNVFKIDPSNALWNSSYLKEDELRGYCGVINIYNFLNDSFTYNRIYDSGYLIARIFVNRENHFFVQGKRQLGFLYNNFTEAKLDKEAISDVLDSAILYTLDFDLFTPPYARVQEVTVNEIQSISNSLSIKTGKRLGFKFQADTDEIQ